MTVGIGVLAGGAGSRFGGATHKLVAPFRGGTVLGHVLDAVAGTGLDALLVTGAHSWVSPRAELTIVANRGWAHGMATSLHVAVRWAEARGHEALVVGLGDQPLITTADWLAVAASDDSPLATAVFGGHRRPPVRIAAAAWPLLPATGDDGARALLRERPDLVTDVPCIGEPADIDTLADLHRWS